MFLKMSIFISSSLQGGSSSLILASDEGHKEVVEMLLSADAHVDLQDNVSSTSPVQ